MIRKRTKVVFVGEKNVKLEALEGGIPLSKGEVLTIHENSKIYHYVVIDKQIECFLETGDQIVNITYILKKKK